MIVLKFDILNMVSTTVNKRISKDSQYELPLDYVFINI